jgi:hypothetical protein
MRRQILAGAALAAWSKTAVMPAAGAVTPGSRAPVAPVAPVAVNTTQATATCRTTFKGPYAAANHSFYYELLWNSGAPGGQCAGTVLVEASQDGANWKTLSAGHVTGLFTPDAGPFFAQYLPGTWKYRSVYGSADGAVKNASATTKVAFCGGNVFAPGTC